MKKVLIKKASDRNYIISEKAIKKNRDTMNLSNDQQGVVGKNINLSLPIKNKDNTVPFNVQLNTARKNAEVDLSITEAHMDKKEVDFKAKDKKQVMDINVETQRLNNEKIEAFKKAEKEKDTVFWDKYVGLQLEGDGQPTKVKDNISSKTSQLPNKSERFKKEKVEKMIMASIKDADAMLLHIYATSAKEGRELNKVEQQQIIDINAGKTRLIAQMVQPLKRSLIYNGDPIIKDEGGKVGVYESNGDKIDEFKSCSEAKANYPEGDMDNA